MTIKDLYEQLRDGKIVSDINLQREIIYDNMKQALVIDSLATGIPLPAFYLWRGESGILEVLDGKQRIEAIRRFKENDLEYQGKIWKEAGEDLQQRIDTRELTLIVCSGTEAQKREIFRRINTLGVPLSPYEVLNGLYHGEYLRGLTAYVAQDKAALRVLGSNSRGKNQMKVLKMLCKLREERDLHEYVRRRQDDSFAADQREVGRYMRFIREIFGSGKLLDIYFALAVKYLPDLAIWKEHAPAIQSRIRRYLKSDEARLTDKAAEIESLVRAEVEGISVDEKRLFTPDDKQELLRRLAPDAEGKYVCALCHRHFYAEELTVDHVEPWSKGGRTELSNAQLLCRACNSRKGNR